MAGVWALRCERLGGVYFFLPGYLKAQVFKPQEVVLRVLLWGSPYRGRSGGVPLHNFASFPIGLPVNPNPTE